MKGIYIRVWERMSGRVVVVQKSLPHVAPESKRSIKDRVNAVSLKLLYFLIHIVEKKLNVESLFKCKLTVIVRGHKNI